MTQQYETEMLRQYFCEQNVSYKDFKNFLNTVETPFDKNYLEWERETKLENSLFSQYVKKNRIIAFEQKIVEVTNHLDNAVLSKFSKYPDNYIITSTYSNGELAMDYTKRKYNDILVAKWLYQELSKIVKFYVSANKDTLIGICKDDGECYERAVDYYKNLKEALEASSSKTKFTEIEDQIDIKDTKKKIYLLKSE